MSAIGGVLLLLPTGAGATVPNAASPGDSAKVDRLTTQIKKLERQYRGELQELRDSRLAAKRALSKSDGLKTELAGARSLVAQIAASQYMTSGLEPSVVILTTNDPSTVLDGATMANHLSNNYSGRVKQIEALIGQEQRARKEAKDKVEKLERTIADLNRQKANVQKLINKYKPESPLVGASGLTGRTVNMRTTLDREFGPFPTIGCLRPGDPGEHGSGRACDFMESTGGSMPSAERQAHGDRVAQYAIQNASRLGIMYVIWKQRIYDMRSPGWKLMGNRGGITANHFDHVHISMF
ncbi:hypothetical protein HKK74_15875 [Actinomadura alba]|uniref:ARB-07466-like C-terminal domain-containing protein n=2 Tax=Actinomadura alba TaxID=406431 RepID=A0ABR7LQ41_9ACTN|nr:hypothetical protein [Actinomadura alba]